MLVTNCSNNYGPYQFPEKLIPLMILNAAEGKKLPVYGDGMNVRDWLFVEDHCRALVLRAGQGQAGRDVQHRRQLRTAEHRDRPPRLRAGRRIAAGPAARARARSLITYVKDRPGHDRRYAIDAGKILRELGWKPEHDFASGLRRTVAVVS